MVISGEYKSEFLADSTGRRFIIVVMNAARPGILHPFLEARQRRTAESTLTEPLPEIMV
jgi:hypothetical protein